MPKLQKFNKKENSKISSRKFIFAGIIILIILSIFVFYKSYAIYKVQKQYDVIKSQIGEFDTEDMILTSVRSQTLKSMFEAAYNYQRGNDSHMMKNTEWGAVAYLSHSKYGINTEVRINNNSSYLTGYAAVDGTDQSSYPGTSGTDSSITLPYNTTTGYKAKYNWSI